MRARTQSMGMKRKCRMVMPTKTEVDYGGIVRKF
jgi:hypothetical protein